MLRPSLFALLSILHLSSAINLHLYPQTGVDASHLSPERASFALSRHLDLEMFEPRPSYETVYYETPIFGKGQGNALVITLDKADAPSVIPDELEVSYTLGPHSKPDSLSSVIYTLLSRARHTYDSIYEGSSSLWQISELDHLSSFLESESYGFAAIELGELSMLRMEYSSTSDKYRSAVQQFRMFLERTMTSQDNLRLAIVTFDAHDPRTSYVARQEQSPLPPNQPPPQQPISSISTCFADEAACQNATDSCSGHGKCAQATKSGHTCFVCLCGVTRTGEGAKTKTERWAGESCERKDISAPFVLLAGTVIVLIVLIGSSVSLLSEIGENELPSTLLSTAVSTKKD